MRHLLFFFLSIFVLSCNQNSKNTINQTTKSGSIRYSNYFSFQRNGDEINLTVFSKDKKNKTVYRLNKNKTSENSINIPLKKVICMSSTHAIFINSLGKSESIKAISGVKYVNNDTLKSKISANKIIEVGYESSLNYEQIIKINPDAIFVYDIGSGTSNAINKLKELGFQIIFVNEFLENTPLAKAEWIKFFSFFFDSEILADSIFNTTEKEYIKLSETVKNINYRPSVLASIPMKNVWYIPGTNSYFYKLISDAGANFIIDSNEETGSVAMNIENVFAQSVDVDFWLNLEMVKSRNEIVLIDERLSAIKAFRTNNVYNNDLKSNKFGGNSYWEEGTIYPHLILRDLINILHPEILNDSLIYYRKME